MKFLENAPRFLFFTEVHTLTDRVALIPLLPEEPTGEEKLSALTALSSQPA